MTSMTKLHKEVEFPHPILQESFLPTDFQHSSLIDSEVCGYSLHLSGKINIGGGVGDVWGLSNLISLMLTKQLLRIIPYGWNVVSNIRYIIYAALLESFSISLKHDAEYVYNNGATTNLNVKFIEDIECMLADCLPYLYETTGSGAIRNSRNPREKNYFNWRMKIDIRRYFIHQYTEAINTGFVFFTNSSIPLIKAEMNYLTGSYHGFSEDEYLQSTIARLKFPETNNTAARMILRLITKNPHIDFNAIPRTSEQLEAQGTSKDSDLDRKKKFPRLLWK